MIITGSEKVYVGNKKRTVFWLILSLAIFVVLFYYHWDITRALHLHPAYNSLVSLMIGSISAKIDGGLIKSLSGPKIHLCNHFLMFSGNVIHWDHVTHVKVTKEGWLTIDTTKGKNMRNRINVGSISHREEFLDDIEKMCEIKEIPFEKPKGPLRFFNL